MDFREFKILLQNHVADILKDQNKLFNSDTDNEILWNIYLNSFPPGTNEIFRERRFYDCSCCRHFIKSFGNVVVIKNNKIITIWDFKTVNKTYQSVIDALDSYVKSRPIKDIFITSESSFGNDFNCEEMADGKINRWDHFHITLPKNFITKSNKTIPSIIGEYRDIKNVFQRSLNEITKDSIETILDLISQKSLYKGEEWKQILNQFLLLHIEYNKLPGNERDNFCWIKSSEVGAVIGKIKNHSIGVLLTDISEGIDLNIAVSKYESIVAPTNYKRPKTIFTQKMVEQAQETIIKLGFLDSLERRFANINDITINNILFADRNISNKLGGKNVFSELQKEILTKPKNFDKIEEINIKTFIEDILPKVTNIELLLDNKHFPNLMSLIAPKNIKSKSMFKWGNNFSWAYQGNITDSMMKERVKMAGGKVDGILRFSIQWNENKDDPNDLDAHCVEPSGNHIYFPNKRLIHPSSGILDVDIITPDEEVAVENITWSNVNKMQEGEYNFYVRCFSNRGGRSGFRAEIEYEGQIYEYNYNKSLRQSEDVIVAKIIFNKKEGIKFIQSLDSSVSSRTIWNVPTNTFHPVSLLMFSPNYWDGQIGIGNKHYFFILNGCKNEESPNGFFNEFLKEELLIHKRVFEALGAKMKVEPSDEQLSGIGFSSTQRNSIICKLDGSFKRTIKIIF